MEEENCIEIHPMHFFKRMSFEIVFFIEILSIAGVFNLSKCGLYIKNSWFENSQLLD